MNDQERKKVETMLESSDGHIGYAYLYSCDGSARQEYGFKMMFQNLG